MRSIPDGLRRGCESFRLACQVPQHHVTISFSPVFLWDFVAVYNEVKKRISCVKKRVDPPRHHMFRCFCLPRAATAVSPNEHPSFGWRNQHCLRSQLWRQPRTAFNYRIQKFPHFALTGRISVVMSSLCALS